MNDNSLGNRIRILRTEADLTQEQFGQPYNLKKSTISQYESGTSRPDDDLKINIAKDYKVTLDWLLGVSDIRNKYNENTSLHIKNNQFIPILGTIKAGIPVLTEENWESQVEVPADLDADFALRVKGDSMSWVGIHDGDLAILCHDNTASHGMIVAAGIEEMEWSATLKFYIKENGTPVLRAANPNYKDIPIDSKHRIIGHVVSIMKETPSILTYKSFLTSKELSDEGWNEVTENAVKHGLNSKQVSQLIDLFSHMVKQMK
jgi:repressor LexA